MRVGNFRHVLGRLALAVVGIAGLALPSCIDLVPVYPPDETPAALSVLLRARSAAPQIALTAVFDPGIDEIGRRRTVSDATLIVAGDRLEPVDFDPDGRLVYSGSIVIDRETLESAGPFVIRSPSIGGLAVPEVTVQWPWMSRVGDASVTVPAGSVARLGVTETGLPGEPAPMTLRWSASAFGTSEWHSRGGESMPPAWIEVPTSSLGGPGGEILALFNVSRSVAVTAPGGEQTTRLDLTQEVEWLIHLE